MEDSIIKRFYLCCNEILGVKSGGGKFIDYAKAYAQAGLFMDSYKEIKDQIPYILSNIQYWRGSQSKEVREELKKIMKELS